MPRLPRICARPERSERLPGPRIRPRRMPGERLLSRPHPVARAEGMAGPSAPRGPPDAGVPVLSRPSSDPVSQAPGHTSEA
eukprot:4505748-Pyramimonas_sp.AAC.1